MMRQQVLRSLRRTQPLARANAARGFASSVRRPAEVELTIDDKKVSVEGTPLRHLVWDSRVE